MGPTRTLCVEIQRVDRARAPKDRGNAHHWWPSSVYFKPATGCTYEREDLGQWRLGLIADEVEEAIDQLAIDNVLGSTWHEGVKYKALDYSRLVALLIPAVNNVSARVKDLGSKVNGASS